MDELRKAMLKTLIQASDIGLGRGATIDALIQTVEDDLNMSLAEVRRRLGIKPDGFVARLDYNPTKKGPITK